MKYSDIINILKNKGIKYPQKYQLIPLPFSSFSGEARGGINAQVKAPIAFSPENGRRTQIYLIDESGTPDLSDKESIFQLGILQGDDKVLGSINEEIGGLRSKWPDRDGGNSKFHHSKDTSNRKELFEEYCLKKSNISFLHYKIDKSRPGFNIFSQEHKAEIYFSALLSAIHDTQYSHGKIKIIASDRPKTFSDDLIYELIRASRIQALIDMMNHPIVGCCLPKIRLIRKSADEYPALDMCDYFISIMGRGDRSFQFKYGGCSLFEASDNFKEWAVRETYYSNDLAFPEGRLLRIIKRKMWVLPQFKSIAKRIGLIKSLPDSIKQCAHDIDNSKTNDEFMGATIDFAMRTGPYLDTKYWYIPLFEPEYLNIKSVGAYFKLLLDYGVVTKDEDPFTGRQQFLYLNWR